MSTWVSVTGYMVIGDSLPCRIGKYGKPFDEEISDEESMTMWNGEICGATVSDMLGKIIFAMSNKWNYLFCNKCLLLVCRRCERLSAYSEIKSKLI